MTFYSIHVGSVTEYISHLPRFLLPPQIFTWNTDAWGYNQNTMSLYQSHPWVFSMLATGEAFGALADTSLRCEVIIDYNSNRTPRAALQVFTVAFRYITLIFTSLWYFLFLSF